MNQKKIKVGTEEIQDEAIKCRHCYTDLYPGNKGDQCHPNCHPGKEIKSFDGEFLIELPAKPKTPWYARSSLVVISFLTVGPLALPLVWFNPGYSRRKKIVITAIVLVLTWVLVSIFLRAAGTILDYYKEVGIF